MADTVDSQTRSRMMAGIRSKNTRPEMIVRRLLHRRGFRYRLHAKDLPGKPDLVFPKYRAVIFVHGCFWHGHGCSLYRPPKSRQEYWSVKISRNQYNDAVSIHRLAEQGWRVCIVRECALRRPQPNIEELISRLATWLVSSSLFYEEAGEGRSEGRGFEEIQRNPAVESHKNRQA